MSALPCFLSCLGCKPRALEEKRNRNRMATRQDYVRKKNVFPLHFLLKMEMVMTVTGEVVNASERI